MTLLFKVIWVLHNITFSTALLVSAIYWAVVYKGRVLTYLLSPLRACSHRKTDTEERHRVLSAACFATWSKLYPIAFISRSTDLLHVSFGRPLLLFPAGVQRMATLGMDVGGIMLTWPIHVDLLFFTSNDMGGIPVRSWCSALDILFGQNMCRILLRYLFWNTSSLWHNSLVTFQYSAAYSSTLSTLLLKMRIFVFLLIIFVFQMFFRTANDPLALLIHVLISASVFPSFVILARRYVNSVSFSQCCSPSLTGSAV